MSYNSNLQNKNLKLQNILNRINNLPTAGSTGGGTDTSDATATPELVYQGETFYSANGKETGTMSLDTEIASQNELLTQIEAALATKASGNYETGVAAGKQELYDAFWDMYQQNGTLKDYNRAFARGRFTDSLFKPKYDLVPDEAVCMFMHSELTNLTQLLKDAGVVLDTSQARYITQMFQYSKITHIPTIDTTASSTLSSTFQLAQSLVEIEKVIVKESQSISNAFTYLYALEEIRFEGIAAGDLDFKHSSKLSKASIESIISCMSTTVSGKTLTLKKDAVNKAFETSTGANDGSSSTEWNLLINGDGTTANPGRTNWTINLV